MPSPFSTARSRFARRSTGLSLLALALGVLFACRASHEPPHSRSAKRLAPPQSSFAALVRTLEVVDAIRDPEGHIEVRSVSCDSLRDRGEGRDYVRVLLDVTVFSREAGQARRIMDDLQAALEAESNALERLDAVLPQRAERVFEHMDWKASEVPDGPGFAAWVSLSDTLRLEVRPGRSAPEGGLGLSPGQAAPSLPADEYVRELAARDAVALGPVETRADVVHLPDSGKDLRVDIRPADLEAHFERGQIGGFLYSIEANSPVARITHLSIERASHLPVASREDEWTFQAVMTIRGRSL